MGHDARDVCEAVIDSSAVIRGVVATKPQGRLDDEPRIAARSVGLVLATVMLATACGGGAHSTSAATLRSCVKAKLAPGTVTRVFTHTEEGVATTNYYYRDGSETDVNVFPSVQAAKEAEAQEARLGDAHDRRTGNVLHGGGGPADRAVSACLH
jgi:hypothetical protein